MLAPLPLTCHLPLPTDITPVLGLCGQIISFADSGTGRSMKQHSCQCTILIAQGVTIPSQRRYVQYYGELMKNNWKYTPVPLLLRAVKMFTVPMFNSGTCSKFRPFDFRSVVVFEMRVWFSRNKLNQFPFV